MINRRKLGLNKTDSLTHAVSNTFTQKMIDEYRQVRGGKGKYNPDLEPYQPTCLKYGNVDIEDSQFRELLLEDSKFLEKHSYERIEKIVEIGWEVIKLQKPKTEIKTTSTELVAHAVDYYNPAANPMQEQDVMDAEETIEIEWNDRLKRAFVEGVAKSMAIDTAFIGRWDNDHYDVFTRNDVHLMYGDKRKIEEVYFNLPSPGYIHHMDDTGYADTRAGFLTQYYEPNDPKRGKSKPHRFYAKNEEINDPTVYRSCVVLQPKPSMKHEYGVPFLKRELKTALRREYVNFYELLYLRKGGVNTTLAYPSGVDATLESNMAKAVYRGIQSSGVIMKLKNAADAAKQILIAETPIPITGGDFQVIADHIKEDSALTQQKVQGAADTGALGGNAPVVNKQEDNEQDLQLYGFLKKMIKDINFVFFEILQDSCEIVFNKPRNPIVDAQNQEQNDPKQDLQQRQKKFDSTDSSANAMDFDHYYWSDQDMTAEVVEHSVSDAVVSYVGNMLAPGMYFYDDVNQAPRIFTKDEIKRMTERDVKDGYLEVMHSNDVRVGVDESVGYFRTTGFDESTGNDITEFHIYKRFIERYPGLIDPERIKVSPLLILRTHPHGPKDMYAINCAIIPKTQQTRAEYSGLDTSATRKNQSKKK